MSSLPPSKNLCTIKKPGVSDIMSERSLPQLPEEQLY
jgi:hypothetical protein